MIHLLKSGSKASTASKKRKVIPILGSFKDYKESKKKPSETVPNQVQQMSIDSMLLPQNQMAPAPENKKKK
jgi:hypothetical protein